MDMHDLPEQKARRIIDEQLSDAGWCIVSRDEYTPAAPASAVTEGLMQGGTEADYLLFVDNRALGVVEAKRGENPLGPDVAAQAEGYAEHPLDWYAPWKMPMPFVYLANGNRILFRDLRDPDSDYSEVSHFHTPGELLSLLGVSSDFGALPVLRRKGLRDCQFEAVSALERSFRRGDDRALIVLATGAGKTFTACTFAYRFLAYTPMRRVLFLVDRNNLGKQAHGEFGMYRLTESGEPFTSIYEVQRLSSDPATANANVVVSTIQRLYSFLARQPAPPDDGDEPDSADPDAEDSLPDVPAPGPDAALAPNHFDLIVVDECHRSIYGRWSKVLEYFSSARIVGLTATPDERAEQFFRKNVVAHYSFDHSVRDGVNVPCRVFDIVTRVSSEGGSVHEGESVSEYERRTGRRIDRIAEANWDFSPAALDREVENDATIRLVLETYRDSVWRELFPDRNPDFASLPKTLVFAKSDRHADRIVEIAREVFAGQDPSFVQKITYSAGDSVALIRDFRNDPSFRIAVTVSLVATGTDVRPLEVLLFMRDVQSRTLFTQMRGRGCRAIDGEKLLAVTPNAVDGKSLFYLVDAVGVTHHDLAEPRLPPGEGGSPAMPLKELLERISHHHLPDENLRLLAARLLRIHRRTDDRHRTEFVELCGFGMDEIANPIFDFLDPETTPNRPDYVPGQPNPRRESLVAPLANNPEARDLLLTLAAGFLLVRQPGEDELVYRGFSRDEAEGTVRAFERCLRDRADEIEALRILSANPSSPAPVSYAQLVDLRDKLVSQDVRFRAATLWNAYHTLDPSSATPLERTERTLVTNLIALVRHALGGMARLVPFPRLAVQRFNLWCGQPQNNLADAQRLVLRDITEYVAANGAPDWDVLRDTHDETFLARAVAAFGTRAVLESSLRSYAAFLLAG